MGLDLRSDLLQYNLPNGPRLATGTGTSERPCLPSRDRLPLFGDARVSVTAYRNVGTDFR